MEMRLGLGNPRHVAAEDNQSSDSNAIPVRIVYLICLSFGQLTRSM